MESAAKVVKETNVSAAGMAPPSTSASGSRKSAFGLVAHPSTNECPCSCDGVKLSGVRNGKGCKRKLLLPLCVSRLRKSAGVHCEKNADGKTVVSPTNGEGPSSSSSSDEENHGASSKSRDGDASEASDSGVTSTGSSCCSWSSSSERQEEDEADSEVSSCSSPDERRRHRDQHGRRDARSSFEYDDDDDEEEDDVELWTEPSSSLMAPGTSSSTTSASVAAATSASAVSACLSPKTFVAQSSSLSSPDAANMCKQCNADMGDGVKLSKVVTAPPPPQSSSRQRRLCSAADTLAMLVPFSLASESSPARRWIQKHFKPPPPHQLHPSPSDAAVHVVKRGVGRRCHSEPPAIAASSSSSLSSQGILIDCCESSSSPSPPQLMVLMEHHHHHHHHVGAGGPEGGGDDMDVDEGIESDSKSDAGVCSSSEDHSNGCDNMLPYCLNLDDGAVRISGAASAGGRSQQQQPPPPPPDIVRVPAVAVAFPSSSSERTSSGVSADVTAPVRVDVSAATPDKDAAAVVVVAQAGPASPKRIRFPRPSVPPPLPSDEPSSLSSASSSLRGSDRRGGRRNVCLWEACNVSFRTSGALAKHISSAHIEPQDRGACSSSSTSSSSSSSSSSLTLIGSKRTRRSACVGGRDQPETLYVCRWVGCKLFGHPCSRSWIWQHAQSHGGVKAFQCMIPGCDLSFSSQLRLVRHVNNHFDRKKGDGSNAGANGVDDCAGGGGGGGGSNAVPANGLHAHHPHHQHHLHHHQASLHHHHHHHGNSHNPYQHHHHHVGKKSCETTPVKGGKKNGRRSIRYRKRPWSAEKFDYFDPLVTQALTNRVVCAEKLIRAAAAAATTSAITPGGIGGETEADVEEDKTARRLHPAVAGALSMTRRRRRAATADDDVAASTSLSASASGSASASDPCAEPPVGVIEFTGEVAAWRTSPDGSRHCLVRWSPEDLLPDEWMSEEDAREVGGRLVKTVPVSCLPSPAFEISERLVLGPAVRKRLRPTRRK